MSVESNLNSIQKIEVPYKPKSDALNRNVRFLKQESHGIERIARVALAVLEIVGLALSVVGIYYIVQGFDISHRIDALNDFNNTDHSALAPNKDMSILLKTDKQAYNHVNEYTIENDKLWVRKRESKDDWKPIYFYKGLIPQKLSVDGANLVVTDQNNNVHYKKVVKEQLRDNASDIYYYHDKSFNNNWKDCWFNLPVIKHVVNLFTGKLLQIPSDTKCFAMSQSGRFNHHRTDHDGNEHKANAGVTTLYLLKNNGMQIELEDPWSVKGRAPCIYTPQTENTSFVAEKMDASASAIMAIGYELTEGSPTKTLKIITRLADIDHLGWNPGLTYTYEAQTKGSQSFVLPGTQWEEHPLELGTDSFVTDKVCIEQTGAGNRERELRVEGSKDGEIGYFYKKMDPEAQWEFKVTNHTLIGTKLSSQADASNDNFSTTVHSYSGETQNLSVHLTGFGDASHKAEMNLTIGQNHYTIPLYSRRGLLNFLGKKEPFYEMVIPKEYRKVPEILQLFKGKSVFEVKVKKGNGTLSILPGVLPPLQISP